MKKAMLVGATLLVAFGFAFSPVHAEDSASYIKAVDNTMGQHGDWKPVTNDNQGDNVVVPEPGTLALLGLGLASLEAARRRKKAKRSE